MRTALLLWLAVFGAAQAQDLDSARAIFNRGEYKESAVQLEKLLQEERALNPVERHEVLNLLGQARTKLALYPESLDALSDAERLAQQLKLLQGLARTYIYMGDTYERMKQHDDALKYYRMALQPLRLPEDWREARLAWRQMGDIHVVAGRYKDAREAYLTALHYAEDAKDAPLTAEGLDYVGYFYRSVGDLPEAMRTHERAIAFVRTWPLETKETWNALARAHNHLGLCFQASAWQVDSDEERRKWLLRAVEEEKQALVYAGRAESRWRQGYVMRALSLLARELAELDASRRDEYMRQSIQYATHARDDARLSGNREWEGLALHHLAVTRARQGDFAAALVDIDAALGIWEKDVQHRGWLLRARAEEIAERRNDFPGARADYLRALQAFSVIGAKNELAHTYHRLSVNLRSSGMGAGAVYFGKLAVNTVQSMRQELATLERESQQAFLGAKAGMYRYLADLLIDEGRLAEAQQVMQMLKEEEFFDFIQRDGGSGAATRLAFTATEKPWMQRYVQISDRLATLGARRDALERKQLSAAEKTELAQLNKDLDAAGKAFVAFMDELVRETAQLEGRRRTEVETRRSQIETLESYQDQLANLGADVAMVHYVVTRQRVRMIVTTSTDRVPRTFHIAETELNHRVHEFREALRVPGSDAHRAGKALYDALIRPIAADLKQAGVRTLMLSLDSVLRYVPFAALYDGENYLVQDYRLAVLTEAGKAQLTERGGLSGRFTGLGVTRSFPGFKALPAVKAELEGILKAAALEGELQLNEAFTADSMPQALARKVSMLHVASHFVFKPGTETDSYLLLGDGRALSLHDIRSAGYNFRGVDLLTLSACNTAMGGGADANGREVEGLGALAQMRGARAVMATLWPVADDSTGLLMQNFYKLRLGAAGMTKAEALREAQLMLLDGRIKASVDAPNRELEPADPPRPAPADPARPYAHPYYWAPFILMGNWL